MHAVYLHGFASSPASSKAVFFGQRCRERGVSFEAPDLNLPDFSTLTVTRMLAQTSALIEAAGEPVVLIGSSLGGFVAVAAAVTWPERVSTLVLLAPALEFGPSTGSRPSRAMSSDGGLGVRRMGEYGIDGWQNAGSVLVFHHGYGRMMPIHYELYEDAGRYDVLDADIRMPILIVQGRQDETVDPPSVEAWSRGRPNAELHLLDDDHRLGQSLPYIWERLKQLVNGELVN